MATAQERVDELASKREEIIDSSISDFEQSIPAIEKRIFKEIQILLSQLELKDGRIKNNQANIKFIRTVVKQKIEEIIINDKYKKSVSKYMGAIEVLAKNVDTQATIQSKIENA